MLSRMILPALAVCALARRALADEPRKPMLARCGGRVGADPAEDGGQASGGAAVIDASAGTGGVGTGGGGASGGVGASGGSGGIGGQVTCSETAEEASLCALGKSAPSPFRSTLKYFRHEYEAHVHEKRCPALACN